MRQKELMMLLLMITLLPGCCKRKPLFADSDVTDDDLVEALSDDKLPSTDVVKMYDFEQEEVDEYVEETYHVA